MSKQVAVVVPGIMGSELWLDEQLIWPGPASTLLLPYRYMRELLDPDLEPTDLIRTFWISSQYQSLIDDLAACGFRVDSQTLFLFPYDWRKSNGLAAVQLADKIDEIVKLHGKSVKISLIAHSMGGLVSRYYLESGDFADRQSITNIDRLITLATPHRGAPLALTSAIGQEKRLFLSAEQVAHLVNDRRYPSLYELLPPADEPFLWDEKATSELAPIPLEQPGLSTALRLSDENMKAARAFQARLDINRRPESVRYFCFVGSRQRTACATSLLWDGRRPRVRPVEQDHAGDGTVPIWSAGLPGIQGRPVGGEHGSIYKNDELRSTLATLLGRRGVLAAAPGTIEVSIRDRVVEPAAQLPFVLTLPAGLNAIAGELRVERAFFDDRGALTSYHVRGSPRPFSYTGVTVESFSLVADAPDLPGVYRLAFYATGRPTLFGSDEFFVQEREQLG